MSLDFDCDGCEYEVIHGCEEEAIDKQKKPEYSVDEKDDDFVEEIDNEKPKHDKIIIILVIIGIILLIVSLGLMACGAFDSTPIEPMNISQVAEMYNNS